MDELYLYDKEKGLFKNILKHSTVIAGRYHVSPDYGNDLNTENLNSFLKDEKLGVTTTQKYPICVCMPPRSMFDASGESHFPETFKFELFFLCKDGITGQNQSKMLDKPTGLSGHHPWYDWKDMKECGMEFIKMLQLVVSREEIRPFIDVDTERVHVRRYTRFNADRVSGASVSFEATLLNGECDLADYPEDAAMQVELPPTIIHPLHKH